MQVEIVKESCMVSGRHYAARLVSATLAGHSSRALFFEVYEAQQWSISAAREQE